MTKNKALYVQAKPCVVVPKRILPNNIEKAIEKGHKKITPNNE